MLVMVGTRTDEHSLSSQVGIGSESDCLLEQFDSIRMVCVNLRFKTVVHHLGLSER